MDSPAARVVPEGPPDMDCVGVIDAHTLCVRDKDLVRVPLPLRDGLRDMVSDRVMLPEVHAVAVREGEALADKVS
jgi:hypothetical protein